MSVRAEVSIEIGVNQATADMTCSSKSESVSQANGFVSVMRQLYPTKEIIYTITYTDADSGEYIGMDEGAIEERISHQKRSIPFEQDLAMFNLVKERPDYKFVLNDMEQYVDGLRNHHLDEEQFFGNGEPIRACAMLEIGYADIELNLFSNSMTCAVPIREVEKPIPVLDYFVCTKTIDDEWIEQGYLDSQVHVDWSAEDWKEQLEKDMFWHLHNYVKTNKISFNHAQTCS